MRLLMQVVDHASVITTGWEQSIQQGIVLFVGVEDSDSLTDIQWAARKIATLRIFVNHEAKHYRSVQDVQGMILSVSQFTLFADIKKGARPSFFQAGEPQHAQKMWKLLNKELEDTYHLPVCEGVFGADMKVSLVNHGPMTIYFDTHDIIRS